MIHHIHAFQIRNCFDTSQRSTLCKKFKVDPDKASLGFRFPCDGPGRGGTCQVSSWDHVFLALSGCITVYQ